MGIRIVLFGIEVGLVIEYAIQGIRGIAFCTLARG
jgi:hypothetical protein